GAICQVLCAMVLDMTGMVSEDARRARALCIRVSVRMSVCWIRAVRRDAVQCRIYLLQAAEHVVEGPVLEHQDDNVLDRIVRIGRGCCARIRHCYLPFSIETTM